MFLYDTSSNSSTDCVLSRLGLGELTAMGSYTLICWNYYYNQLNGFGPEKRPLPILLASSNKGFCYFSSSQTYVSRITLGCGFYICY